MIHILEILTRDGVIEPIMFMTVFSSFAYGYFRLRSKKIELQKMKLELLKNQSEMEIKQRLESLEEIITRVGYDLKAFDENSNHEKFRKKTRMTVSEQAIEE